ncbi:hypothetical protein FTV88_2428 [Heliorestis convoluta]|uniref:Uncharacterized protein n=1 Tax=Heliorestis convoluta TaxID=356322 RepID=A0A5Q2N4J8_9FIRM|nr:hypothetical protein FTV88_2428 [Heliorestis convoluta]
MVERALEESLKVQSITSGILFLLRYFIANSFLDKKCFFSQSIQLESLRITKVDNFFLAMK